ncbi:MAG: hypothetical protein ACREA0_14145, partial [bacterium]
KNPSLSVRELDDGTTLMHCFGCGANGEQIAVALGLHARDLFPQRRRDTPDGPGGRSPIRNPWASDDHRPSISRHDVLVLGIAFHRLAAYEDLVAEDMETAEAALDRLLVVSGGGLS